MPMETRKSSRDKTSVENLELSTGLSSNICNSGQQEGESGQQVRVEDGGILTSSMAVIEERGNKHRFANPLQLFQRN